MTTLILIAKECIPGRVKTRLHPPLTLDQAAELAAASLADTLDAARAMPASRRILAYDGNLPPVGSELYEVIQQVEGDLDERLAAVFDLCRGPTVLIGMDTPQITARHLAPVFEDWPDDVDAWVGPANDGGYWTLAMAEPRGDLIRGVQMSQDTTAQQQLASLASAGLRTGLLDALTDVDTVRDALEVAAAAPHGRFAETVRRFAPSIAARTGGAS